MHGSWNPGCQSHEYTFFHYWIIHLCVTRHKEARMETLNATNSLPSLKGIILPTINAAIGANLKGFLEYYKSSNIKYIKSWFPMFFLLSLSIYELWDTFFSTSNTYRQSSFQFACELARHCNLQHAHRTVHEWSGKSTCVLGNRRECAVDLIITKAGKASLRRCYTFSQTFPLSNIYSEHSQEPLLLHEILGLPSCHVFDLR